MAPRQARPSLLLVSALAIVAGGCGGREKAVPAASPTPRPTAQRPAEGPLVAFLGDSLTAGLGLPADQAYPAVVAETLAARGKPVRVVNAGISGDTTAGGLRRTDWLLAQKPAVLVVALGANDGLRAVAVSETESNLRAIVEKAKASGARVLLCGMLTPTNYGPEYGRAFAEVFPRVARDTGVRLLPFLLEGVAGDRALNQASLELTVR